MLPVGPGEPSPGFIASLRFRGPEVLAALREAAVVLATKPGFVDVRIARAVDDASLILFECAWESVGAYRRALSSYDVKVSVVPVLSQCIDEATAFETLHVRTPESAVDATGALAADADSIRLGEAAAGFVPPAPA